MDKDIELLFLSKMYSYTLFFLGMYLGQFLLCGLFTVFLWKYPPIGQYFFLASVFFAFLAMSVYEYRGYITRKLKENIENGKSK